MKFFLIAFALIAAVVADVSHLPLNEYLPPVQDAPLTLLPTNEYIPPAQQQIVPAHELGDDGYHYKTQRRVVYRRNRRDVSHLPSNEYLPPTHHEIGALKEYLPPVQEIISADPVPIEVAPAHELGDDGYHYKTQRRVVYRRNRRDVSHLALKEYLPPAPEVVPVEVAPIQDVSNAVVEDSIPAHDLAEDGYRYKTHRRVFYRRNRRDVSHIVSNKYLPPMLEAAPAIDASNQEETNVEEVAPAHELSDDGYHYKTQRRIVYRRNRRDVSHLVANEYLPPVQEHPAVVNTPSEQQVAVLDEALPAHELSDDGYHYKTQRRVVYRRNRRDVSHLPSNEYLPPVMQDLGSPVVPLSDYLPPVQQDEPVPAHELTNDGYRYKTHRRVVYRRH